MYEVIPKRPDLFVARIDDFEEPAFPQRGFIYWLGSYPWTLKNRGIGIPADDASGALAAAHNFYFLVPPRERRTGRGVGRGLFRAHPEFYPLNKNGTRHPGWSMGLCATNPELPEFLANALLSQVKEMMKRSRGKFDKSRPIPAAQGDGFTGCYCCSCRELVIKEQSEAAPIVLMLNRALERLGKSDPEIRLITFAYFETLDAPRNLKPHRNLWINVVSSAKSQNTAGDQVGPIRNNPANRDYARALRAWPRIASGRVTVWHWTPNRAEWPAIFYLAGIMKYWHECGIYGTNPQLCGTTWADLYAWVYLKLAWNPAQDANRLIRQFIQDNYGKAGAPHVWRYLRLAQAGYEDSCHVPSAVRWTGWTTTTRLKIFHPSLLRKMIRAMDKAMAAAEKSGNRAHLANLIKARGTSLDIVVIDAATHSGRPWGPVMNPDDGKTWFVPAADPRVPRCLMRAKQGIVMSGGGEPGPLRSISWYVRNKGGPLVVIEGQEIKAAVCPDLRGQVTSAVHKPSGKELLAVQGANAGYCDVFTRVVPSNSHQKSRL